MKPLTETEYKKMLETTKKYHEDKEYEQKEQDWLNSERMD
jgi:hypothetical protein